MKNKIYLLLIIAISLCGCETGSDDIQQRVDDFILLYQERTEFEKFLDLYDKDMVLEDMITGYKLEGIENFKEFFNWPDKRFKKLIEKTFIVTSTMVDGNSAIIKGHFTPFEWDGQQVEAMQFMTLLEFNDQAQITRHVDWINYPNYLIDYANRGNSNQWIQN